ncbi:MAG: flagellar hook-basal body protein [Firmicutes bacterium HGW-Firmicutes-13]|nr:MAG: flagellar hook-basal body protein [Firmicutes bacterium HGW-Firmicutes-13]
MQRSLYAAVSGMRNHQTRMDIIGNNIANVNTTAFKSSRVRFQDILSQTLRGASGPQEGRGGINPIQVGLGMSIAAIDNNHTQGSLQYTGRSNDLAIEGSGFFIVSDGRANFYTRDGAFSLGPDGLLVNSASGYRLQGWSINSEGVIDTSAAPGNINIPLGGNRIARATDNVFFAGNLNASEADSKEYSISTVVYDSQGNEYEIEITFTKNDTNEWGLSVQLIIEDGDPVDLTLSTETINFTPDGNFITLDGSGNPIEYTVTIPSGQLANGAEDDLDINLNFFNLTQVVGPMDALARYQDGYSSGVLDAFTISKTGIISGVYDNGMVKDLGMVALAGFANPEGLSKIAGNMYQVSANSGQPLIGEPGQQGLGTIEASTLEMSNVDLVSEFTDMITTSRAFQANSRVISTSDDMLVEVVNLKR